MQGDRESREKLLERYAAENEQFAAQIAQLEQEKEAIAVRLDQSRAELQRAIDERMQVEARKTRAEKDCLLYTSRCV